MVTKGVSIAPAHPDGEHTEAYRMQQPFPPNAKIRILSKTNPWRRSSPGRRFFDEVLVGMNPVNVGQVIEYGQAKGFTARQAMNHLRWLFTWGGVYVKIGGRQYGEPADSEPKEKQTA